MPAHQHRTPRPTCRLPRPSPSPTQPPFAWQINSQGGRKLQQYVNNLLLKINLKAGGVNWHAAPQLLAATPTLVVGLDVQCAATASCSSMHVRCASHLRVLFARSHPSPGAESKMASFVGISAFFFDGSVRHHVQTLVGKHTGSGTRPEIVPTAQLQPMMVELLKHFRERAGTEARRVLFYRDGVGDSQFEMVHEHEIRAIRSAFRGELVFICAQKRNPARCARASNTAASPAVPYRWSRS